MNYKIIYQDGPLYIEAIAENEEERKEVIKGIAYSIKDVFKTPKGEKKEEVTEYATDKQIIYMQKLGILFPEGCTKKEAVALIHQYKREHGIPDKTA